MNPSNEMFSSCIIKAESPILPFGGWRNNQQMDLTNCLSSDLFISVENKKLANIFNFEASNKNCSESTNFTQCYEHKNCQSSFATPEIITQFDFIGDDTTNFSDNLMFEELNFFSKKQRLDYINDKNGNVTTRNLDDMLKNASIFNNGLSSSNYKKKKGNFKLINRKSYSFVRRTAS